ncbi:MAG: methyl-accepting chemotaxis protein [Deltaproteobacteria bacterium]|nr:methyl-accepting chemotaxis protein [Deltaproteobacteria bacterium]MBN2671832.1 methyl-accepting chemotaxis protein [Deltaproteobacteria bacterium]
MKKRTRSNNGTQKNFPLTGKLVLGSLALTVSILVVVGFTVYFYMGSQLEKDARERIKMAVISARQMIDQSVSHTIQSQLQATADRNRDIVAHFYEQYKSGKISEAEAKRLAKEVLLSQKIGKTGYLYAVDSTGTLRVHPKKELVGVDISQHGFVQEQIARKNGYVEYNWKNPGEKQEHPKSLSMSYFEPWDYIISASAYREEFLTLINLKEFKKEIMQLKFGETGYAYVIDTKGTLLIHPQLEGKNIYDSKDANGRLFIQEMCKKKNGMISYPWKNPGDRFSRMKDVVFRYYPVLDIIVAGGIYQEELYKPLQKLQTQLITVLLVMLLFSLPLTFLAARAIARPVLHLSRLSRRIADKDLQVITEFDQMEEKQQKGGNRLARGAKEIVILLQTLREAGVSIRTLVSQLSSNASKLSSQADIVEAAANDSNTSATNQSSIVSEVSNTIDSLQDAFKRTEQIAVDVFTVSQQAVRKGAEGRDAVHDAQNSMKDIIVATETARTQLNSLSDLSNQIVEVVKSLEQIADNSQMLAINASIEAAEAGEAGKGFAVVASEVQELAIQSAKSTQHIRSFLQQIGDTAKKAVQLTDDGQLAVTRGQESISGMETVLHSLTQVLDSNNRHADQISRTIAEQSSSISQISYAISHVLENSQQSAQNVMKLMKAVDELNRTRAEFEKLVSEYQM